MGAEDEFEVLVNALDVVDQRSPAQGHSSHVRGDLVVGLDALHEQGKQQVNPVSGFPGPSDHRVALFQRRRNTLAVHR